MNRREAIYRVAGLMGAAFSAPLLTGLANYEKRSTEYLEGKSYSVSEENLLLIETIAELIIPQTKTPGAKAAKVPEFIIMMVEECYAQKDRERFYSGLNYVSRGFARGYGKIFVECAPAKQIEILNNLEKNIKFNAPVNEEEPHFFTMFKELTLFGYFTSEIGCTQALEYLPVPGAYKSCIPLEDNQKTWAL